MVEYWNEGQEAEGFRPFGMAPNYRTRLREVSATESRKSLPHNIPLFHYSIISRPCGTRKLDAFSLVYLPVRILLFVRNHVKVHACE